MTSIETRSLGHTSVGEISYAAYQIGIDNYRYEFFMNSGPDSLFLFSAFLNDATYTKRLKLNETEDTITVLTSYPMGTMHTSVQEKIISLKR